MAALPPVPIPLPASVRIVDPKTGNPTEEFSRWLARVNLYLAQLAAKVDAAIP